MTAAGIVATLTCANFDVGGLVDVSCHDLEQDVTVAASSIGPLAPGMALRPPGPVRRSWNTPARRSAWTAPTRPPTPPSPRTTS